MNKTTRKVINAMIDMNKTAIEIEHEKDHIDEFIQAQTKKFGEHSMVLEYFHREILTKNRELDLGDINAMDNTVRVLIETLPELKRLLDVKKALL